MGCQWWWRWSCQDLRAVMNDDDDVNRHDISGMVLWRGVAWRG